MTGMAALAAVLSLLASGAGAHERLVKSPSPKKIHVQNPSSYAANDPLTMSSHVSALRGEITTYKRGANGQAVAIGGGAMSMPLGGRSNFQAPLPKSIKLGANEQLIDAPANKSGEPAAARKASRQLKQWLERSKQEQRELLRQEDLPEPL